MAKFREPEYCPVCGKQLQAIHSQRGKTFVGDTFVGYKECDHKSPTVDKEAILKKAMNKKYCGETYFDFLDDEEKPLIYKAMESFSSLQNSELRKENEVIKESLFELAKRVKVYVDFSNKTYDGDKEAPMDAVGVIQYLTTLQQSNEEKDREVESLNEILSQKMELLRKANERIEELEKQIK